MANESSLGKFFNDTDNKLFAYLACSLQHPTHLISITEPLVINLPYLGEVLEYHNMVFYNDHFFPIARKDVSVYKTTIGQCINEMSKKIVDFVQKNKIPMDPKQKQMIQKYSIDEAI